MNNAFIFDLDGTLADCSHRTHYCKGPNKNYRKFFEECSNDKPIEDVIEILTELQTADACPDIIICSGRSDEVKYQTELWLCREGIGYNALFMRKAGDYR